MNTASLELCRELRELSGWVGTDYQYYPTEKNGSAKAVPTRPPKDYEWQFPAYDLGYLLRKLPWKTHIYRHANTYFAYLANEFSYDSAAVDADTPEDALAKLAIELLKQGILTKEQS